MDGLQERFDELAKQHDFALEQNERYRKALEEIGLITNFEDVSKKVSACFEIAQQALKGESQ